MDGIVLINKQKGYTSHDIVSIVKKITKSKVGHTGTLDPNATGVLPLLLGNATKISKYLMNHNKEYEATLKLGIKTTTADAEGEIIEEKGIKEEMLEENNIKNVLNSFLGKQAQVPPIYSAIKVNGKKLYDYARQGKNIEIEPRQIEIYEIELIKVNVAEKEIKFRVKCSKGTYIRSLCEDIANKLGTVGFMKELNRTQVGNFKIEDAQTIEEFEETMQKNDFSSIITIEEIFKNEMAVILTEKEIKPYLNGVKISYENIKTNIARVYYNDKFLGLGIIQDGKIKRDVVISGVTE